MEGKREYSLDVLKILGTILIVFHHYQQTTNAFWAGKINFFNGIFYFGYIVELFFVLSGYFMFPYIRKIKNEGLSFPSFFVPRFLRFQPLLAISDISFEIFLVLYLIVYQTPWRWSRVSVWGTLISSLGIQMGWGLENPEINDPTWYISVLLLCYILFYLSVSLSRKTGIRPEYLFILLIFVGFGLTTYGTNDRPFLNIQAARGYVPFFWGLLLAGLLASFPPSPKFELACCVPLIVIPLLIRYANDVMDNVNYVLTFVYYPALIVVFKSKWAQKLFHHRWIGTLGAISFDVYLWHRPLFPLMYVTLRVLHLNVSLSGVKGMLLFTAIAFAVGTLSYFLIERPAGRLIRKKLKRFYPSAS